MSHSEQHDTEQDDRSYVHGEIRDPPYGKFQEILSKITGKFVELMVNRIEKTNSKGSLGELVGTVIEKFGMMIGTVPNPAIPAGQEISEFGEMPFNVDFTTAPRDYGRHPCAQSSLC